MRICLGSTTVPAVGRAGRARHPVEDLPFLAARRVADLELEHEAVHLRLGQRVGAFLLDRVLRGQHQERLLQLERLLADGDLLLLHRFEQRALHLGRRAVDFVGQDQVGEDRPLARRERAGLRIVDLRADEVRGQQVRRELDPRELDVQAVRPAT